MAIARITHDGNGMLERTRVVANRTEAQCSLDTTTFPSGCEVGSIVAVDKAKGTVGLTGTLKGILANTERTPDQFHPGLKEYKVPKGGMAVVLFLDKSEEITTNTVCYDTTEFATESALITALDAVKTTALYGIQDSASGAIKVTATETGAPFAVVKKTTLPDGQMGVKFICLTDL